MLKDLNKKSITFNKIWACEANRKEKSHLYIGVISI
jgi:hypothetical protein